MRIIVNYQHPNYLAKWNALPSGKFNGAYYYSQDIENYILPHIQTERPVNTIGIHDCGGENDMIVFVHHYLHPENYKWLKRFKNIIIVSSDYEADKVLKGFGNVIHLPLSVPVAEVAKHKKKKTQNACYIGNPWSFKQQELRELVPPEVHRFGEMPREQLWDVMAEYKIVYAIGLCAIEAQVLGAKLEMSRYRYPDPAKSFPVLDCGDAGKALNIAIKRIEDGETYVDCSEILSSLQD